MFKNKRNFLVSYLLMLMIFSFSNFFALNTNAKSPTNTINYTVKKGDTFYLLALRFNSSVNEISSVNPKIDPQNLIIGSKIKLSIGSGITLHYVKKGDTLREIAMKHNSTVSGIAQKNNILNPNLIYAGDILAIDKTMQEMSNITGTWRSTGTTKYHSTVASINPTGYKTFNIYLSAWAQNAFGSVQMRDIMGRGEIKDNKIEFVIYEPQLYYHTEELKGEITLKDNIMQIEFIGDIGPYSGSYVGFETEFYRESKEILPY